MFTPVVWLCIPTPVLRDTENPRNLPGSPQDTHPRRLSKGVGGPLVDVVGVLQSKVALIRPVHRCHYENETCRDRKKSLNPIRRLSFCSHETTGCRIRNPSWENTERPTFTWVLSKGPITVYGDQSTKPPYSKLLSWPLHLIPYLILSHVRYSSVL